MWPFRWFRSLKLLVPLSLGVLVLFSDGQQSCGVHAKRGGIPELMVRQRVDDAVATVRKALDATRNPVHAADVQHSYDDKFGMVELATETALMAHLKAAALGLGMTDDVIETLQQQRGTNTVTLRFNAEATSSFRDTKTREENSDQVHVHKSMWGTSESYTQKTITEHFWDYSLSWHVSAFIGTGLEEDSAPLTTVLVSHSGSDTLMTSQKSPVNPLPQRVAVPNMDVDITWLLDAIAANQESPEVVGAAAATTIDFRINRSDPTSCKTPRRNPEVDTLIADVTKFIGWCGSVGAKIKAMYGAGCAPATSGAKPQCSNYNTVNSEVFVPVAAMLAMEEKPPSRSGNVSGTASTLFSREDLGKIMQFQEAAIDEHFAELERVLPTAGVFTIHEAGVVVTSGYIVKVWQEWMWVVDETERMLRSQLVESLGKHLTPHDFARYMDYHNRKFYLPEFAPTTFSYAVRRPDHYPEGVLSIEDSRDSQPISTTSVHKPAGHTMRFKLNAAVEVELEGEHYVHTAVFQQFSTSPPPATLELIARARQFSSFVLLIGSLASNDVMVPEHALIIQNKDELKIPLLLETIPAPKEFRDAIASLSPEQQQFCKAYRKMQLAGTVFAVAIVQIKPQLERLLNLPSDALTKEVKLCQDLMSLFMQYQIPSDLLAYSGPTDADGTTKVETVKQYVAAVQGMLDAAKKQEIEEEAMKFKKANPGYSAFDVEEESAGTAGDVTIESSRLARANKRIPEAKMAAASSMPERYETRSRSSSSSGELLRRGQSQDSALGTTASLGYVQLASGSVGWASDSTDPLPPQKTTSSGSENGVGVGDLEEEDYTALPGRLDANFERFDRFNKLRATTIKTGQWWWRTSQKGLLSKPHTTRVAAEDQNDEQSKAFDLLDALSKSGGLPLQSSTLHVVVAATYAFDLGLINTVVQDNVNPIDQMESAGLIMASTLFSRPAHQLVQATDAERIASAHLSDKVV